MIKTLLTGVKPTNTPHLGNYLGAIRPSIELISKYDQSYLFIADYHALTSTPTAEEMKQYTLQVAATWLACGLDPERCTIYRQSDISEIFELSWILSCVTPKGFMNRAHAYKARVQENQEDGRDDLDYGVSMGLFTYPVLMSADILLFDADTVPVGEDQVQHVEFARDIAQKFNRQYGEVFKLPSAFVQLKKTIPGLDGRKMSKSYGNHIPLFLDEKKLRKLVMKIVTDSTPPEAPKSPENSSLFELYKAFAGEVRTQEMARFYAEGISWGEAKQKLFEVLLEYFAEATEKYNALISHPEKVETLLQQGAKKARSKAQQKMHYIRSKIGV